MPRYILGLSIAIATILLGGNALAQSGTQDYKVGYPLLANSDEITLILEHHFGGEPGLQVNPPWIGWAGYKFTVHVLDSSEVDVDAVRVYPFNEFGLQVPGPISHDPFGPRSNNVQSSPREWIELYPGHEQSGGNVANSDQYYVADLELHIKGTNVGQNSDTDLEVKYWNIWHFRQGFTSNIIVNLKESDRLWVPGNIDDIEDLHVINSQYGFLAPPPPFPPLGGTTDSTGHWLHVDHPLEFHFYGSQYYATLVDTITVGIEHYVPEPAAMVLVGLGVACAGLGVRARRRRRIC